MFIVGCEPKPFSEEDQDMEMSGPVRAAVDEAVEMVQSLIARILAGEFSPIAIISQSINSNPNQEVYS